MRIGEIAALVGVTPRAVRHYHQLGLLPEPVRRANGYRSYTVRDAVLLARIRRLTELGLGLDEVRDVLADDGGRELVEVLEELDDDLRRQEAVLHERRSRLAGLLAQARAGRLTAEGPVSPALAELFHDMAQASAGLPESPMAAKDREMLTLLETVAPAGAERERLMGAMRAMAEAPGAAARAHDVYVRLDALADASVSDPRVAEAAGALADLLPPEVVSGLGDDGGVPGDSALADVFFAEFSPAQEAVIRLALRLVRERAGAG
ncbi:MerR family transcriptional regulator [Streptomyces solicathayae]|uniref:MerR family transcriptional regulator n=1 Tax=Streptomyces solicathayae TaxID=3081768 RepID=A0ABZ0LZD1_9ACTN|nr:MerR family transcriptional regulator [Streptomyces sp. HUAS YS2]WOX24680.1 MerR family transcriptional regulator [Streptomyces sp. HUAS YS2]